MSETSGRPRLALGLLVTATVLGLMGTDLVLPAVPYLPEMLGGDAAAAQFVLASYVAGTCVGLVTFGALGDRFGVRPLVIASLLLTGAISLAAAAAPTIWTLIGLRGLQGAVAAAPAVFAPAIVRALFDERGAIRAIGALGSIEGLAPALAPIIGVWLLALGGWQLSFWVIGVLALLLAALNLTMPLIPPVSRRESGSYLRLLLDPVYLRYSLSQSLVLGGLLVFVFGAPAVLIRNLGGTLNDFIIMQVIGIAGFILAANLTARFNADRMILFGTAIAAAGAGAMLGYSAAGGSNPWMVIALFLPINTGLGLRGPPAVYRAIAATHGDEARGGALLILFVMAVASAGTALVAPFIVQGLLPLAATVCILQVLALILLRIPKLPESASIRP